MGSKTEHWTTEPHSTKYQTELLTLLHRPFETEVQHSLSVLEPSSMDSLGHQHHAKKLRPKIPLHFKLLCESKAMLPKIVFA